jgi:hypothetical protein
MRQGFDVVCVNRVHLRDEADYLTEILGESRDIAVVNFNSGKLRDGLDFVVLQHAGTSVIYGNGKKKWPSARLPNRTGAVKLRRVIGN